MIHKIKFFRKNKYNRKNFLIYIYNNNNLNILNKSNLNLNKKLITYTLNFKFLFNSNIYIINFLYKNVCIKILTLNINYNKLIKIYRKKNKITVY